MSSSNILRLVRDALVLNGERLDLVSGNVVKIRPNVDDTGSINIGDGTYDMDVKTFLGASTKYVLLDVGNSLFQLEDVDMLLGDNDELRFGDGTNGDRVMTWNGTYLECGATGLWANAPSPADPQFQSTAYEFFDDFTEPLDTTDKWSEYVVGTGTQAVNNAAGGTVLLSCQAVTDDACEQMYLGQESFLPAAGKHIWYETRLRITGTVQSEHSFGLCAAEDLSAVADVLPADGISFSTQDATLAAALTCSKNGTDTGAVAGVHTLVTATWVTLGFYVNGVTSVTPYVNGTAGTAATATINDDEPMSPYFLVRNGDGTTQQKMEIDYVRVVQLR